MKPESQLLHQMSKHSAPFPVLFLHCREMDDADGWDLHAVVRSCAASSTTTTDGGALPSTSTPALPWFENPTDKRRSEDFKDFRLPLVSNWSDPPQILPFSEHNWLIFQQISKELLQQTPTGSTSKTSVKRYKKRKSVMKKQIYRVDAEKLSSDVWSWRKYGQKPIKGSPFPRSYYRCSSSKLCTARKQVERDKSNPEIFLVTYTAEHNHPAPSNRKSLTGVTRQKPTTEMEKTEKQFVDGDNTDNCDFRFSHMALDDFFGGMESVIRGEGERCSWDSEPTFPVNSGGSGAISGGN